MRPEVHDSRTCAPLATEVVILAAGPEYRTFGTAKSESSALSIVHIDV